MTPRCLPIQRDEVFAVILGGNKAVAKETCQSFSDRFCIGQPKRKILPVNVEKQITDHLDHTITR